MPGSRRAYAHSAPLPTHARQGLLARGPCAAPDGNKVVSFFNTGHHAAFNKLGGDEVIIATVRDGVGTLVRWGQTVVSAINRVFPPEHAHEVEVRSAFLQFDMATGEMLTISGFIKPEVRNNMLIYGIGGILVPFIFIKLIDLLLVAVHLAP